MKKTGDIIKSYREKMKYSTRDLAEKVGTSPTFINSLEKDRKNFPKTEVANKIIEILRITSEDVKAIRQYEDYRKTPESVKGRLELLENLYPLPDNYQVSLTPQKIQKFMSFPAYSEDIAGTGKVNFEDGPMHRKVLYIYAPENCFCIEITGESMFPVINKGEIVIVNRGEKTLETERYYVVTYNNETFIKQILCPNEGLIVLHSHNQDFKDIYVMGENIKEIKVHGRIVKVVSEREL